jgi:hypothetical protein
LTEILNKYIDYHLSGLSAVEQKYIINLVDLISSNIKQMQDEVEESVVLSAKTFFNNSLSYLGCALPQVLAQTSAASAKA